MLEQPAAEDLATFWRATPGDMAEYLAARMLARKVRGKRPKPSFILAPHIALLNRWVMDAVTTDRKRLIVAMPPQHGKSTYISQWFPVWMLEHFPDWNVILASYGARYAGTWGRRVRNTIKENEDLLTVRLAIDSKAANRWNTQSGGGMVTDGVGGGLTGQTGDVIVVDDPFKNMEEANSPLHRAKVWEWWESVIEPRLGPDSIVIVMHTRWHVADLAGMLIEQSKEKERTQDPDYVPWKVLSLPALAEQDDPLGRAPGEPLFPQIKPLKFLMQQKASKSDYVWEALYQQRPSPASGGTFQRGWFRYYEIEGDGYRLIYHADQEKLAEQREEREQKAAEDRYAEPELKGVQGVERTPGSSRRVSPHDCQIIPTLDCASSDKEDADFTCLQIWAVTPAWEMLLIDRWLERAQTPDVVAKVAEILRGYNLAEIYVEKNGLGLGIVQTLRRLGFIVKGLHAHTNKVLRSQIAQLRAQAGYVYLPLGAEMTEEFLKEVETFPRGANDDQVDAFSWASIVVQKLGGPVMTAVDHAAAAKAEAAIRAMEQQADDANTPGARIQSVDTATEADDPELREWLAGSDG